MTILLFIAGDDVHILLTDATSGGDLCATVNRGQWQPPPALAADVPAGQLRALRLGKQVVLVFALSGYAALPDSPPLAGLLSPRQTAVLHLLAQGHTAGQIAAKLGLSRRTVFLHLAAIRQRLRVYSNIQAVLRAAQLGLWGRLE